MYVQKEMCQRNTNETTDVIEIKVRTQVQFLYADLNYINYKWLLDNNSFANQIIVNLSVNFSEKSIKKIVRGANSSFRLFSHFLKLKIRYQIPIIKKAAEIITWYT